MKKDENGSVTLIVLVTVLFIVIILSSFLVYISSRRRAQLKETEEIAKAYGADMGQVYNEIEENVVVKQIAAIEYVSGPDKKEYYSGESVDYTGLKIRILYDDGTQSEEINGAPYASRTVNSDITNSIRYTINVTYNGIKMNQSVETYKKGWYGAKDSDYCYYNSNGQKLIGGDYYLPNFNDESKGYNYYYFNSNGIIHVGWRKEGSTWYYYISNPNGADQLESVNANIGTWIRGAKITASTWIKIGGKWYYLKAGVMQTGWLQEGGHWYYLREWRWNGRGRVDTT